MNGTYLRLDPQHGIDSAVALVFGQPVTLTWKTFKEATNQAGISRRYGGIHFKAADLAGRAVGRLVTDQAWDKAVSLWSGGKPERSDQ